MNKFHKYLHVGETEKNWGFYINTVGYSKINPHSSYPNNKDHPTDHSFAWNKGRILNGYYLIFITRGEGIFESALTRAQSISAGTCFLLFPGVWHRYKPDSNIGWEEYWIGFKGAYPEELMKKKFFRPETPFFNVGLNDTLLSLFQHAIEAVQTNKKGYYQLLPGLVLQILGLLHTINNADNFDDKTSELIAKAKYIMQESLDKKLDLNALLRELPMGYSKFRKAFKKITGESPNQYHLNLRFLKAKELLVSTSLTIDEISYLTGFDTIFYFSKYFKRKMGVSPKTYRGSKGVKLIIADDAKR